METIDSVGETLSVHTVEPKAPEPLRSKHTSSFSALRERLGISLRVTTYQAGKLVLLRAEGDDVNTDFRNFPRPIGLAADLTRPAWPSAPPGETNQDPSVFRP